MKTTPRDLTICKEKYIYLTDVFEFLLKMEPILVDLCPINMPKLEFRSDSDLFGDSRWLINPDMMMGEEEDFVQG